MCVCLCACVCLRVCVCEETRLSEHHLEAVQALLLHGDDTQAISHLCVKNRRFRDVAAAAAISSPALI